MAFTTFQVHTVHTSIMKAMESRVSVSQNAEVLFIQTLRWNAAV